MCTFKGIFIQGRTQDLQKEGAECRGGGGELADIALKWAEFAWFNCQKGGLDWPIPGSVPVLWFKQQLFIWHESEDVNKEAFKISVDSKFDSLYYLSQRGVKNLLWITK